MIGYMNRKEFKQAMSGVQPSKRTIDRLIDMPNKDEQKNKRIKLAPAFALVACFAIVLTGIFGGNAILARINPAIDYSVQAENLTESVGNSQAVSKIAPGFVMVAYANDDKKNVEIVEDIDKLDVSTNYLCKIEVTDIRSMSEKEIEKIFSDKSPLYAGEMNGEKIYYQCLYSTERLENTLIGQAYCGFFDFDLDKDTVQDVKEIRVSNKNTDYGIMEIRAEDCIFDDDLVMIENRNDYVNDMFLKSNSQSLDGDRYRKCMRLNEEYGGKYFGIIWKMNNSLFDTIDENPDFDLSTIKDTIIFEVEFNDGSISKSIIDVAFDNDGKMYAVDGDYKFIE